MRTVTAIRPPGLDELGNALPGADDRWDIDGVLLAPVSDTEDTSPGRAAAAAQFDLYARGQTNTGLAAGDFVEVDDIVFEVDGVPQIWDSGNQSGTVARLKRVNG